MSRWWRRSREPRRDLGTRSPVAGALRALGAIAVTGGLFVAVAAGPTAAGAGTPQLEMTTGALPPGMLHVHYSTLLTASGGTPPYRFWLTSGTLPKGLHVRHWMGFLRQKTTGEITGKPKAAGTWTFTVTVIDHKKASASETLSIVIGN